MARSSLLMPAAKTISLAVLATSMLVALFSNRVSGPQEPGPSGSAGPDIIMMMQGKPLIDRMGSYEQQIETLSKDAGIASPLTPPPSQVKPSYMSLVASSIRESVSSLGSSVQHLADRAGIRMSTQASTGVTIVMVILCTIIFCCLLSFLGFSFRRRKKDDAQNETGGSQREFTPLLETGSPPPQFSRPGTNATLNGAPAYPTQEMRESSGSFGIPDPRQMMTSLTSAVPSSCTSMTDVQRQSVRPPPLCPTLVMPMSEALLGIQMYELAQLSQEGALNIVGISGKPLLRAEVKRIGAARALEISMPEPNSIPRATIAPPTQGDAAHGGRALEIRGMRGSFYGILQMQSSGACYVVKDGQTVLTIDGDAESLQLALKSAVGMQLASVKCSTEQFEGVDHVELRVEPGVDTVLVVAVVLAVLLLSPYLPPED